MTGGGAERVPGGAEPAAGESSGLQRRKLGSTSGLFGDRTPTIFIFYDT